MVMTRLVRHDSMHNSWRACGSVRHYCKLQAACTLVLYMSTCQTTADEVLLTHAAAAGPWFVHCA